MKMSKNYKKLCVVLGLSTILSASIIDAANYTKNLKATYSNIQVSYNGIIKSLSSEPFAVDGTTYIPLRGISDIMGTSVKWDGVTKTIAITDSNTNSSYDTTALQQELATANYNVATLTRELEITKAELAKYKTGTTTGTTTSGSTITTEQLAASEKYLQDNFSEYFPKIVFEFDLKKSSNKLLLTVSYSTSKENSEFDDLSKTKLKNFFNEICGALTERHTDMSVEGTIFYDKGNTDKYSFTYSKSGTLDFEAIVETTNSLVEDTIDKFISESTFKSSNVDALTKKKITAYVSNSSEKITYKIYVSTPSTVTEWNANVNDDDDSRLEDFMKDLQDHIQEELNTNYEVSGDIYDNTTSARIASYDDDEFNMYKWE